MNIEESTFRALEPLPQCRNCPALARPNILMFRGPVMWLGHRTDAQQQRFAGWLNGLVKSSAKPRSGEQRRLTHGFGFGLLFSGHVLLYAGEGGLSLGGQGPLPFRKRTKFHCTSRFFVKNEGAFPALLWNTGELSQLFHGGLCATLYMSMP